MTMQQTEPAEPFAPRLWAGVHLRRYAARREDTLKRLEEGREYIRGYKLTRADSMSTDRFGCGDMPWHGAINAFSESERQRTGQWGAARVMYTAKMVSDEVPRMILLFEQERRGLPTSYKMCGHDPRPATPLPDNHLRCVLNVQCRNCPMLKAIESSTEMTNEAKDEAKAWTCATHILLKSQESAYFEGFVHDKSDDAFEERMLSLGRPAPEDTRGCDTQSREDSE
jgi:hypothetical protein